MNLDNKAFLHDVNKFITTVANLIENGDNQELKDIVEHLGVRIQNMNKYNFCSHSVLNSILCERKYIAESKDILFNAKLGGNLKLDFIEDLDLISIVGNLLDNAIEAAEKAENNRYVVCKIHIENNDHLLIMEFYNSYIVPPRKEKDQYISTIKGIAEKIEAFKNDTNYVIDPCLVQLKKSVMENSQSVAKVLFHAGTGTLTPYNTLLSYIEKDSKENEAIIGFTFGDDADYISMETSQTFRLLGEKYGKILHKLGYSNYILIGHCVGGLIALETAQYLQKKNVQVSDVTLISSNIPKKKNQTILSQATDEIYRKTLQSSLDNEILLERIFAKLIGADAYKAGYQVDEERLQQYIEYIVDQGTGDITVEALCNTGGKFGDVAEEFRLLASKSVSERLNALYNTIERPNGELMEHQLKMLNILFRVFSQNFRCVSTYEPKPYYGNIRIFCCEIQGGHFYPGFFAEDYETWKPYAKGNLTFELIKGWHLDCITEPNLGENIKKILEFNY